MDTAPALISNAKLVAAAKASIPTYGGHPDYGFAAALSKVSPEVKAKAQKQAQNFEGMFLNSMFSEMTNGVKGEGPFGNTVGTASGARCRSSNMRNPSRRPAASASPRMSIARWSCNSRKLPAKPKKRQA